MVYEVGQNGFCNFAYAKNSFVELENFKNEDMMSLTHFIIHLSYGGKTSVAVATDRKTCRSLHNIQV